DDDLDPPFEELEREPRAVGDLDAAEVLRIEGALQPDGLLGELLVDGVRERLDLRKELLHVTGAEREELLFPVDATVGSAVRRHLALRFFGDGAYPVAHHGGCHMRKKYRLQLRGSR